MNPDIRSKMIKLAHQYAESARVAIRGVRHKAFVDIKKGGIAGEDDKRRLEKLVDEITKASIALVDTALARKEKDLNT